MDELATLEPRRLDEVTESALAPDRRTCARFDREHDAIGVLVVKQARSGDRPGLRREAEVLQAVGGTALVRFVELRDLPDATELVVRDTGGPSLAAVLHDPSTRPADALEHLAEACDVIQRLHTTGWTHGRICADHVLLTPRGRMRLCSVRDAAPIEVDPDQARRDRASLLRMVDDWVRSTAGPANKPWVRLVSIRVARRTRRLVDDPDPVLLARVLRRSAVRAPSIRSVLGTAIAATAVGVVSILALGRGGTDGGVEATAALRATTTSTTAVVTGTTPVTPMATTDAAPVDQVPIGTTPTDTTRTSGADRGCDGCTDGMSVEGNTVTVGTTRYRLGRDGDLAVVGDWDCDGDATAALLRPSTGEVHTFDAWPTGSEPLAATALGTFDGATAITAAPTGCGPPVVTDADGTPLSTGSR